MKMLLPAVRESILIVIMVMTISLVMLQCKQILDDEEEKVDTTIRDIDLSTWQQAYNENQKLLVLLYRFDKCERCPAAMESLAKLQRLPEIPSGLKISKSFSADLLSRLEIKQLPTLVYLRDKSHVVYDGNFDVPDLLKWLKLATNKIIHRLDDESFGRLTNTSAGAGTDDWLVIFYKEQCKNVLPVVESFGVRVHGRINVAKVIIPDSPRLTDRFSITACPEVLFFKHGKMYKYQLPTLNTTSLRDFVDNSYKNIDAEAVPQDKPVSIFMIWKVREYIEAQLQGDITSIALTSVVIGVVTVLLIIVCCCRSKRSRVRRSKKTKKE